MNREFYFKTSKMRELADTYMHERNIALAIISNAGSACRYSDGAFYSEYQTIISGVNRLAEYYGNMSSGMGVICESAEIASKSIEDSLQNGIDKMQKYLR